MSDHVLSKSGDGPWCTVCGQFDPDGECPGLGYANVQRLRRCLADLRRVLDAHDEATCSEALRLIMLDYCKHCFAKDPRCQCWNDE